MKMPKVKQPQSAVTSHAKSVSSPELIQRHGDTIGGEYCADGEESALLRLAACLISSNLEGLSENTFLAQGLRLLRTYMVISEDHDPDIVFHFMEELHMLRRLIAGMTIVLVICLTVAQIGCKKSSDSPTEPEEVAVVNANGSITPVTRTSAQGTVFVTDASGNAIMGLTSSNAKVVLRWKTSSSSPTDSVFGTVVLQTLSATGKSIAVALTMDYSGSMYVGSIDPTTGRYKRIADMESAVKTFVNAMGISDRAEIIKFGGYSNVNVVQTFTTSKTLLTKAADTLSFDRGNTALYKSIVLGITDASTQSSASYARAVVAFTDGGENDSYISRDSLFRASRRTGIPVYTVGLLDSTSHASIPSNATGYERDLIQIADTTGGFYFYAPNASGLAQIYTRISGALSNAYAITITWPSTGLPVSGTTVTAVVTITYNGLVSTFTKQYTMP